MNLRNTALVIAGIVGASVASSASAAVTVSDPFFTINASAGAFSGSYAIALADPSIQVFTDPDMDIWFFNISAPVTIASGPNQIAQLVDLTVIAYRNTQPDLSITYGIDMSFRVNAGTLGDTSFTLTSPLLSFDAVMGSMTGSGTRGGSDQNINGINLSPGLTNGFGLNHSYNGSTTFADYFNTTLTNGPTQSVGDAGNTTPVDTWFPIPVPVSSLQTTFGFTVSNGDTATGTSSFGINYVPTPGSAALTLLSGGFLLTRRRRA